jgi:hypothetical protein
MEGSQAEADVASLRARVHQRLRRCPACAEVETREVKARGEGRAHLGPRVGPAAACGIARIAIDRTAGAAVYTEYPAESPPIETHNPVLSIVKYWGQIESQ